jgi:hypothetical protein
MGVGAVTRGRLVRNEAMQKVGCQYARHRCLDTDVIDCVGMHSVANCVGGEGA